MDTNPSKTKSNCLCLPFFGHFLTPLERVAATTSSRVFFFFSIFNKDTKKTSRSVYIFIIVLNNLLRLGHKGRRTPVIHTEKEK